MYCTYYNDNGIIGLLNARKWHPILPTSHAQEVQETIYFKIIYCASETCLMGDKWRFTHSEAQRKSNRVLDWRYTESNGIPYTVTHSNTVRSNDQRNLIQQTRKHGLSSM